ncbi:hypothetical protein NPIL_372561 [Nephila pilipes]|uniref:Uncharacterized protein n=1 Tax=Nephila pilipes TaxID=299642 RepID=A0A8X6QJY1_NEPPI|nr:hypothetical protein NPIL_372561 [Nephila pilipes]
MGVRKVYFIQFEKERMLTLTQPHFNIIEYKETNEEKTGGGEVPKEVEWMDMEMRFLVESILTQPMSTPFDSDSTKAEISIKLRNDGAMQKFF